MLLIELMNYLDDTPVVIKNKADLKDDDFVIETYSQYLDCVFKKMEKYLNIEDFCRIITDCEVKSIYYDDVNFEAIVIVLKENRIFSKLKDISVWFDYSENKHTIRCYNKVLGMF